jgi:hypothetical protein
MVSGCWWWWWWWWWRVIAMHDWVQSITSDYPALVVIKLIAVHCLKVNDGLVRTLLQPANYAAKISSCQRIVDCKNDLVVPAAEDLESSEAQRRLRTQDVHHLSANPGL